MRLLVGEQLCGWRIVTVYPELLVPGQHRLVLPVSSGALFHSSDAIMDNRGLSINPGHVRRASGRTRTPW